MEGADGAATNGKRDWLFPVILGLLLAGSAVSFALAFVQHITPHQELKISSDHNRPAAATDRPR
jgi:hypothetical protein